MITLSTDENMTALDQMIAADRVALARLRYQLNVHRDILQSPAATITELEAQAIRTAQVVEYLEQQRASFAPHTGKPKAALTT